MFTPYRLAPLALLTALAEVEKQEAAWLPYQAFLDVLAQGPIESVVDVRNRLAESMTAHPDRMVEFIDRDRRLLAELDKMIGARLPEPPEVEAEARANLHKAIGKIAPYDPARVDLRRRAVGHRARAEVDRDIIIEVPAPALDLPPATTGRLDFERAIKKARKRRRGRR